MQDCRGLVVAVQSAQRNDRSVKISNIGLLVAFIVAYVAFSLAIAFVLSTIAQNYLMDCMLSFASIGIASYLGMHFVLPNEMAQIDTRLLHELAKHRLVEFRPREEESSVLV